MNLRNYHKIIENTPAEIKLKVKNMLDKLDDDNKKQHVTEVTGCNDCKFRNSNDYDIGYFCILKPTLSIEVKNYIKIITPKECPLKEKDYLFTFKK